MSEARLVCVLQQLKLDFLASVTGVFLAMWNMVKCDPHDRQQWPWEHKIYAHSSILPHLHVGRKNLHELYKLIICKYTEFIFIHIIYRWWLDPRILRREFRVQLRRPESATVHEFDKSSQENGMCHTSKSKHHSKHIEAETKWTPFRRRHFQWHFLEWKCVNSYWNFTEVCL